MWKGSGLAPIFRLAVLLAASGGAAAQDFPAKPVEIVNPFQPGSATDLLARALATGLERHFSQGFTVVNKPGAAGATGTAEVAQAPADGYRLLFAPALVISVLPTVRPDIGYRAQSLAPVCQTFHNRMAIVVRNDSRFASLRDLVQAARESPGVLKYAHPGQATIPHLAMEEILDVAAIEISAVSYSGGPAVIDGLRAGHVDAAAVVLGAVADEGLRVIAIFADERHPAYPAVETVKEQGFEVAPTSFGGLMAPAATPPRVVNRLASACDFAARNEPYVSAAKRLAQPDSYYANVATFRHRLQRDIEVKRRLLIKLGATQ